MKNQDKPIEAEFIVIEDRKTENTLECPRCGCEFDIDAMTCENLVWERAKMAYVAQCPLCHTQQN